MLLCLFLFYLVVFIASLSEAISAEDQELLKFLHVWARVSVDPPAANMRTLLWSEDLENLARIWANKCSWGFPDPSLPDEKPLLYVGINVAMISTERVRNMEGVLPSIANLFNLWYVNKDNFDHELNICRGGFCGQYKQVIWATTEYIGCERGVCDEGLKRHVLVCCYYPPGNDSEIRPYEKLEDEDDFPLDEEPWIMLPLNSTNTEVSGYPRATTPSALVLMCFLAFLFI
ncbi:unnamed protein product [Taenia asiatica]|uniref:SCP domain-containing protein n=1 Tax=Taenia asiatica TaxID=60517 RepID=A0A0R3VT11_TAEAS|nr:unnamed protein product [Taenia asiatica]